MARTPVGKFRLWTGQPVNAPFVTPPIGLRAILLVCVLSVIGTLFVAVARQLSASMPSASGLELFSIAFFGFVLPVMVAVTIATNRVPSRVLSLVYFGFVAYKATLYVDTLPYAPNIRAYLAAAIGLLWLGMLYWMYKNARMRIYYALISDQSIPADLVDRADELTSPGKAERLFGRFSAWIGAYTEVTAAILILAFVALAWVSMGM